MHWLFRHVVWWGGATTQGLCCQKNLPVTAAPITLTVSPKSSLGTAHWNFKGVGNCWLQLSLVALDPRAWAPRLLAPCTTLDLCFGGCE